MATLLSNDGRYAQGPNHPPATWTCLVCRCLVMTGERTAHKKPCDAAHAGFGS